MHRDRIEMVGWRGVMRGVVVPAEVGRVAALLAQERCVSQTAGAREEVVAVDRIEFQLSMVGASVPVESAAQKNEKRPRSKPPRCSHQP